MKWRQLTKGHHPYETHKDIKVLENNLTLQKQIHEGYITISPISLFAYLQADIYLYSEISHSLTFILLPLCISNNPHRICVMKSMTSFLFPVIINFICFGKDSRTPMNFRIADRGDHPRNSEMKYGNEIFNVIKQGIEVVKRLMILVKRIYC